MFATSKRALACVRSISKAKANEENSSKLNLISMIDYLIVKEPLAFRALIKRTSPTTTDRA